MSIALADPFHWDSLPTEPIPPGQPAAVEVRAVFRGVVTHARILSFAQGQRRKAKGTFTIGSAARVDAPVAAEYVPWSSHTLVMAAGDDYLVNVTPGMTGIVRIGGQDHALASFTRDKGHTFALPAAGVAQLDCGASSFIVTRTSAPRSLPRSPWRWDWAKDGYTLGSAVALAAVLLVAAFIPSDPRSLSLDLLSADSHFVRYLVTPALAEPPQPLPWLKGKSATATPSGETARAQAEAGTMGNSAAPRRNARFAIKGDRHEPDPMLAKTQAVDAIRSAGVLGVLKANTGAPLASIFGRDNPFGDAAATVMGNLVGNEVAAAYGRDGWGVTGTGSGAAGTGDKLVGSGVLGVIGDRTGGGEDGRPYGRSVGTLHQRHAVPPHWVLSDPQVRGGLDKEIVRRVIRLHLNEIKYCYEQELVRMPSLAGRILVQFTITPAGQVLTAAMQSSTLGNARVENCTVQAIRRWQFPQPAGGGLVGVSYPFLLAPTGN